jgi:DNA primase
LGRIPEATIHEVRDRADIVGVIGRYVELKRAGRSWIGLCPFHDEKTPSFNVNSDSGFFHCFGCQTGGDVLSFLVKHDNLTFPEAVRSLAADLGIEIPDDGDRSERGEREALYAALEQAQRCYRGALQSDLGKAAREYLERRGLDSATIERFGLGFAPDAWDTLTRTLERAGVPTSVSASAGLVLAKNAGGYYDRLRGRVTFPIHDVRARVIAFGGRALGAEQEPKYLNTSESPVYHKRRALYGLHHALEPMRRAGRAVVCEGYFDAIALHRAGIGEAVATCGTALTPDHATDLGRRTNTIHLLFDGDNAGQNAMEKALMVLLPAGIRVRAVTLPGGCDPDDYLAAEGAEALQAIVDAAPDAIEVVIRRALSAGRSTPAEKADAVRHVAPMIAAVANPVERDEYARRLAIATGAERVSVESVIRSAAQGGGIAASAEIASGITRPRGDAGEERHLRLIALILSRHPDLATDELCAQMQEVLPDSPYKNLIVALVDAASDNLVDADGRIDVNACADRLSPELHTLLRDVGVKDDLLGSDEPAKVLTQVVGRYVNKDLEAKQRDLMRRLQEPGADHKALLRERDLLQERKRSATGLVAMSDS